MIFDITCVQLYTDVSPFLLGSVFELRLHLDLVKQFELKTTPRSFIFHPGFQSSGLPQKFNWLSIIHCLQPSLNKYLVFTSH